MANEHVKRLTVVATNPPTSAGSITRPVALYLPDGSQAFTVKKAAAQADTVAADLAALKVDFNALLAKLRTAGVISTS